MARLMVSLALLIVLCCNDNIACLQHHHADAAAIDSRTTDNIPADHQQSLQLHEQDITTTYPNHYDNSHQHLYDILISIEDNNVVVFACFVPTSLSSVNENKKVGDEGVSSESVSCCNSISESWQEELHIIVDQRQNADNVTTNITTRGLIHQGVCQREIATVPTSISDQTDLTSDGNDNFMAKYVWTVVVPSSSPVLSSEGKLSYDDATNTTDSQNDNSSVLEQYWWSSSTQATQSKQSKQEHHRRVLPRMLVSLFGGSDDDNNNNASNNRSRNGLKKLQNSVTMTPFHRPTFGSSLPSSSTPTMRWEPISIESALGDDGGMHRLWYHSFHHTTTTVRSIDDYDITSSSSSSSLTTKNQPSYCYYVIITLPSGMFIDLDDPLEVDVSGFYKDDDDPRMKVTKLSSLGITSSYRIEPIMGGSNSKFNTNNDTTTTTTMYSPSSYDLHLHAAKICDIEQPAFVSGQHMLVWEVCPKIAITEYDTNSIIPGDSQNIDDGNDDNIIKTIMNFKFATKVHLRYPNPTPTLHDWINLPSPIAFQFIPNDESSSSRTVIADDKDRSNNKATTTICSKEGVCTPFFQSISTSSMDTWQLGPVTKVWVATGTDDDHLFVVFVTVVACLIGVIVMLRDISMASVWDDP